MSCIISLPTMDGRLKWQKKNYEVLENIVLGIIFLVLVQTFLEDFAVIAGWSWSVRKIMIISGLFFDLFFTIEFLVRLYNAVSRGNVSEYLTVRHGWIDLLASVPLLIFNSAPAAAAVLMGGSAIAGAAGILNVLKVIKAVRIARILRLLRILKVVKQIKNTDSVMAQRHVTRITTLGVSVFVFILLIISVLSQVLPVPTAAKENESEIINVMMGWEKAESSYGEMCTSLLIVKEDSNTVYTKYDNDYYSENFGYSDYIYAEYKGFQFFFDNRSIEKLSSVDNLAYFIIILALVLSYTFIYSPHFAMTISDPIHVMRRGFNEKSYNYEVKVIPEFEEDDIFKLAKSYNDIYLPLKDREAAENDEVDADSLELKLDDIKNMF